MPDGSPPPLDAAEIARLELLIWQGTGAASVGQITEEQEDAITKLADLARALLARVDDLERERDSQREWIDRVSKESSRAATAADAAEAEVARLTAERDELAGTNLILKGSLKRAEGTLEGECQISARLRTALSDIAAAEPVSWDGRTLDTAFRRIRGKARAALSGGAAE